MKDFVPAPEAVRVTAGCELNMFGPAEEPTVRCRHKRGECERCGTREGDVMHRTEGGRGAVARLIGKR